MTDQADFDRMPEDTRRDFARRLSHVQSEVGLYRRDIDTVESKMLAAVEGMRQECKADIVGTLEKPGIIVRLDRLEQARIRDLDELRRWIAAAKWITGGSLAAGIAALAAALKAYGQTP